MGHLTLGLHLTLDLMHLPIALGSQLKCLPCSSGDEIVAVDGVPVSACAMEEVTARLIGDDVAGTLVTLTVRRKGSLQKDVKLKRISSESLADKVQVDLYVAKSVVCRRHKCVLLVPVYNM